MKCKECGRDAGWFRDVCKGCRIAKQVREHREFYDNKYKELEENELRD